MASVRERSALDWCSTRQQSEIEPNSRPWLSNTGVEQKLHGCSACLKCRSPAVLIGWPCIAASDSAQVPIMLRAVAAVAKSRGSQLGWGLRLAATAQDAGGLIKNKQRAGRPSINSRASSSAARRWSAARFYADRWSRRSGPGPGAAFAVSRCINLLQRCHDWAMTEETAFPVS